MPSSATAPLTAPPEVAPLVDRWVSAGIISPEQAARIRADLATLSPQRAVSLVAEGLGYLGGVIVVVGVSLLLTLTWDRLTAASRVAIVGGVAVALLVAGALVPARRLGTTGPRLRGVLWVGATAAVLSSLLLAGTELLTWGDQQQVLLVSGAGSGVFSAVLWAINRHVLQQVSTVVPVIIAANTATMLATESDFLSSLAVWSVGVVWFVLSLPDVIPARGGGAIGGVSATIGGLMMIGEEWGPVLALGTVLTLVLTAVARKDLLLLAVGSVGTLIVLPIAVQTYFEGVLPAAISLVVAGLALVAVGVSTARRRQRTAG